MRPEGCPRSFEVEAMRDGRLGGRERANFERHVGACPACAREVRAMDALAAALRAENGAALDELHTRRERTRLLAAFDATLVSPAAPGGVHRWMFVPALAAAVVAVVFVLRRAAPVDATRTLTPVVHADDQARWSEYADPLGRTIVLERGTLAIHVDHTSSRGRLLVVLPDGELEDTGTTFTVSADDGRTTRVTVDEGSIVLRLRSQAPVALGPSGVWSSPVQAQAARLPPATEPGPEHVEERRTSAPPAQSAAAFHATPPLASTPAPDSSAAFREAMAALDAGDSRGAAALFKAFLVKHPGDAHAEDAAYLRIIALQRSGDASGVKQAAGEYLAHYPAGFRRAEVEGLSP